MGGHAVRYYGVDRNTIDFDLVTAIATTRELRLRLPMIGMLGPLKEELVWRTHDFARYEIGKLPDGRPKWLEFWLRNHLLDDFAHLKARAEIGSYGSESVAFLSLTDLIRSKETERESDWTDITLLEEIFDARNRDRLASRRDGAPDYLSSLRSRRGMDLAVKGQLTADREVLVNALAACKHPVTCVFLYPFVSDQPLPTLATSLSSAVQSLLSTVIAASPRHFAVIEIARRDYKRAAMDRDRADKQAQLRSTPR
jgi:hypothetical protein